MERKEFCQSIGYIFKFFSEANRNGDDVIITEFSEKGISLRLEFKKEGIFRFEDKKEQA